MAARAAHTKPQRIALWIFLVAFVATLVEAAILHVDRLHFAGFMVDFRAFYCAGAAVNAGADPYLAEPLRSCEVSVYGAFPKDYPQVAVPAPLPGYALAPFALLAHVPYGPASILWEFASAAALVLTALTLTRLSRLGAPVVWATLLLPVILVSGFLGQLVPFALLALTLCAREIEGNRPVAAALAAVATLIEPHFGLPVCLGLAVWVSRSRPALALLLTALGAFSVAFAGLGRNLEYLHSVLPAHLASEVANEEQYSLTHLLNLAGVPDTTGLALGGFSYLVAIAAGTLLAGRLVAGGWPSSLYVLLPAAFAPIGGSFVHLQQMAFVLPALLVLAGRTTAASTWLGIALLLLALPYGYFTFLYLTAPLAAAALIVLARDQLRLSWVASFFVAAVALLAIFMLCGEFRSRPDAHAAVAAVADGGRLAEATWSALIRTSYHDNVVLFTLSKIPTYVGLAIFAIVTIRLALPGRDDEALVEPETRTCVA